MNNISMYILGIGAYYHDSSAVLLKDGEIVVAIEEERISRKKHDFRFPKNSILKCLEFENITLDEIDYIVFYDKPLIKFERILETFFQVAPLGFKNFLKSIPIWIKEKIFIKKLLRDEFLNLVQDKKRKLPPIYFSEHHLSHAASAFYPSGLSESLILCVDGVGEWATTSIWKGHLESIVPIKEIHFPHSLGLYYSAFTYYLGFKVNSGEYKMMGLAPYGEPKYVDLIWNNIVAQFDDGSYQLNMDFFNFLTDDKMTGKKFEELFGHKRRLPDEPIEQFHKDLAKSSQDVLEKILINMIKKINLEFPSQNLCLSGGVALNCVANGKIKDLNLFKKIWIQPAAGDSGGALGAALAFYHLHLKAKRKNISIDSQAPSHLGLFYTEDEIKNLLLEYKVKYDHFQNRSDRNTKLAKLISDQNVIGLFQGRMEFGPRALGARSIIGDPRNPKMQSTMNLKIKKRESFRPFAPAILIEDVHDYFDWEKDLNSPYMLLTTQTKKPDLLLATTHVDKSARIQTVSKLQNSDFYDLILEFKKQTGCPVIINTSFNVRGEPIVNTPYEALKCFMTTDMDVLVLENFIIEKNNQTDIHSFNWTSSYAED